MMPRVMIISDLKKHESVQKHRDLKIDSAKQVENSPSQFVSLSQMDLFHLCIQHLVSAIQQELKHGEDFLSRGAEVCR